MATLESTKSLYTENVNLAYTEMQLSKVPIGPFDSKDKPRLKNQANNLAMLAADLRSENHVDKLDQSLVDNTRILISKAQTMFDMVNNKINVSLNAYTIFEAVDAVIESLSETLGVITM